MARPKRLAPRADIPASRLLGLEGVAVVDCQVASDGGVREIFLDALDGRPDWPVRATAERWWHDIPFGVPTRLLLRRFRRVGPAGERICVLPPGFLDGNLGMTVRAAEAAILGALENPFAEVERRLGIPRRKVSMLMAEFLDAFSASYRPHGARVIGMDGVHLLGSNYTVIADVAGRSVLDLLDGHDLAIIRGWLQNLPGQDLVRVVTMDLSEMERAAVRAVFPRYPGSGEWPVRVVADKRHVLALVLQALARYRTALGSSRRREGRSGQMRRVETLKALVEKPGARLDADQEAWLQLQFARHSKGAALEAAYRVKEGFLAVYACGNRRDAEAAFAMWRDRIPAAIAHVFATCVDTIGRSWREEVFSYFDGAPVTTAYVEAVNRTLKRLVADGRGNLAFQALRARVLFAHGNDTTKQLMRRLAAEVPVALAGEAIRRTSGDRP